MDNEEFNSLLNGPLSYPFPPLALTRVILALSAVVEATGETGAEALRQHCAMRERADRMEAGAEDEG